MRGWAKPAATLLIVAVFSAAIYVYYPQILSFMSGAPGYLRDAVLFAMGFLGAASVVVPVPYTAFVFTLSSSYPGLNAAETALFVGLGSGLGEVTGWLAGKSLSGVVESLRTPAYSAAVEAIRSRARKSSLAIPLLVFLFALTPLPDDLLFIILGALGYPLSRAIPASVLGKILMVYILVEIGKILGWAAGGMGPGTSVALALTVIAVFYALLEVASRRQEIYSWATGSKNV